MKHLTRTPQKRFSLINKGTLLLLAVGMAVLWYLAAPSVLTSEERMLWEKVRAAQQQLSQWRESNGTASPKDSDPWNCGLIGVEWSGITTTLGELASKRTACNPAWVVQFSRWFREHGLKPGDHIAIYASGSFPGLLLNAIAATEAMELEPLLIVSLGASTWGANHPDAPWPVLAAELRRSGFIRKRADYYTLGGGVEMGHGLPPEGEALLRKAAKDAGVELLAADKLEDMIARKTELLEGHQPHLFVSIGGSHANLGDDHEVLRLHTGLIPVTDTHLAGNGVIGAALRNNIPVIHMLNVKSISNMVGIPYDSAPRKTAPTQVSEWWSGIGVVLFFLVLLSHRRWRLEPVVTLGLLLGLLVVHSAFGDVSGASIESVQTHGVGLPHGTLKAADEPSEPIVVLNKTLEIDLGKTISVKSLRNMSIESGRMTAKDASKEAFAASSTIAAPIEFTSLGVKWTASSGDGALGIAIRTSIDAVEWSSWTNVGIDEHLSDRFSKVFYSNLLSVPRGVSHIQYSVRVAETQGVSASPALVSLTMAFIDPGQTPLEVLEQLVTDKPLMLSRTEWGCPDGEESRNLDEVTTVVTHLIVHHTATSNSSADWPATVRAIWSYHAIEREWGDIGYNFLIDPLGTIYVGRAGGDNIRGAHFSCQNGGTQGIGMLGDFTSVAPTAAAIESLEELLAWLASREGIDPVAVSFHSGTQLDLSNIAGHRDGNPSTTTCSTTVCPGNTFYPMLPGIRSGVEAIIAGSAVQIVEPQPSSIVMTFDGNYRESSGCYGMIEINDEILANIYTLDHGCVLHRLDARGNHQLLSEIDTTPAAETAGKQAGFGLSPPLGGWYFFEGDGGVNGNELWRTDGSGVEAMVNDDPWVSDGIVLRRGIMNDRLYFSAGNTTGEYAVYSTDGLSMRLEPDLAVDAQSSADLVGSFYDKLFYTGSDAQHGKEPWVFDGSEYQMLEDIIPGSEGSGPRTFFRLNDRWFFAAQKPASGDERSTAFFNTDSDKVDEIPHSGEWYGPFDQNDLLIKSGDSVYLVADLTPLPGDPVLTPPPAPTPVIRVSEASSTGYDLGNGEASRETASGAVLGDDALVLIGNRLFRLGADSGEEVAFTLPSEWDNADYEFVGSSPYFNQAYIKETAADESSRIWAWSEDKVGLVVTGETSAVTDADHFRHIGKDIYFYGEDDLNGRALRKIPDALIKPVPWMGAVTGSWYDPATSGQGFTLHVINENRSSISFYTFEDDGTPLWLTGIGTVTFEAGHTVEIDLLITSGGDFGTFTPDQISNDPWGTLKLTFNSCRKATAVLDGQTGRQSMDMVRLAGVEGLECYEKTPPSPETAGITGSWYDPATSGQGFVLHSVNDGRLVVSFYGYKDNSERLWLVGLYDGQVTVGEPLVMDVLIATGGNFGAFAPEDITRTTWGTLTLNFDDCKNATATLDGLDGQQTMNLVSIAGLQGSGLNCD